MPILPLLSFAQRTQLRKATRQKSKSNRKTSYDRLEPRNLLASLPIINEFLASNSSGLFDDNGSSTDWIEIFNASNQAVNLAGYSLTDNASDPTKFVFPSQTLGAGQYLVVFAGDDADTTTGSDLYTGFGLSSAGEYVGLYDPSGTVISSFAADGSDYPAQQTDVSYGALGDGTPSYFATPTPGAANANPIDGIAERVTASLTPGFFDTAQVVSLSTPTAGATIRYTIDGSTPSATNGLTYSGPININSTTTLRAVATRTNYLSVPDRTWSYLFLDDVLNQSNDGSAPAGFPADWGANAVDYGIDPDVRAIEGDQAIKDALLAVPSWSITTDIENLFDANTGIYANALEDGIEWERPASVELLNGDGSEGFQVNAGLRIRGGFSRLDSNPKHSFRLFFRGEYGDSELNYPVHGDSGVDTFEKLDLRTAQNYSWSKDGDQTNNFITDVISRQNQAAAGQPYTRSAWLHLYINGQYWGLFQTQERAEANFGASYFGGEKDDYDVIKVDGGPGAPYTNEATDGNLDAYERLFQQATALDSDGSTPNFVNDAAYLKAQGLNPDGTRNEAYEVLLDVDNLIDYTTEILASGNFDAPISQFLGNNRLNNYYALRDRTGDEGFKFFVHDSEHSLRDLDINRNGPFNHSNFDSGVEYFNPQTLHQKLMANAEYRLRFADSIQEKFFNDGIYTAENQIERWEAEAAKISSAIIAESARWGDAETNNPLLKSDWEQAVADVRDNILANRNPIFLDQLRNTIIQLRDNNGNYSINVDAPLFPGIDAPNFFVDGVLQSGGEIAAGDSLSFDAQDAIYYTVDGTDPRLVGGGINPNAILYNPGTVDTTIFESGSTWRFEDSGANLGTTWVNNGFNDSSWGSGASELGYGDGDEATVVSYGSDANDKHITTYFRKTFNVAAGTYTGLTLNLRRDDGAVVYLNGTEIVRSNLPGGTINYLTEASGPIGNEAETTWHVFDDIDPSLLLVGNNTLAVEIHQVSGTSSDITFDAELTVTSQSSADQPYILDTSTNVQARTFSNGEWSAVHNATFFIPVSPSAIRISEIHFNPADPSSAEIAAGFDNNDDFEFIELFNPHPVGSINLDGLQFSNGITFDFGNYNLLPGERVVVVEDVDAFMARYGDSATVLGEWSGALNNGGERITLLDNTATEIISIDYGNNDPWHIPADGAGFSLVLNDPVNTPIEENGKYYSWRFSSELGGTPGEASADLSGVVINEILAHTDAPQTDSIELFNPTGSAIDVGGWYLSDSGTDLLKFQIPAGTVISAGGYLVFDESDFNPTPGNPAANHFALSSSLGDEVYLSQASGGTLVGLQDAVEFNATFNGESLGRLPDGSGRLTRLATPSFGGANGDHAVGPLVISEVNYHPADPSAAALAIDSTLTDNDLEYIEIVNPGSSAVDLTNWRLRGEADYDFVAGTSIPAGGTIVVLSFDPADSLNADKLAAFVAHYGISSTSNFVGGLSVSLSNSTGRISLQQPDSPDATLIPRVVVDEVVYDDLAPWADADGSGESLHRDGFESNGNLAASWFGDAPTPGTAAVATAPVILSSVVNGGDAQRSVVDSLVVTFEGAVEFDAGAIDVIQRSDVGGATGSSVGTSFTTAMVNGNTVITIIFTDNGFTRNSSGALVDGNYQLTIDHTQVRRAGSNVTLAEDFVFGDQAADRFFTYFGDYNGDRTVNIIDLLSFRSSYLGLDGDAFYNAASDFNGDGSINVIDLLFFRQRYRQTLAFV